MAAAAVLSKASADAADAILSRNNTFNPLRPTTSRDDTTSDPPSPTQTQPYTFSFSPFLRANGLTSLISSTPVCPAYLAGHCPLGRRCPDRHPTPSQPPSNQHGSYASRTETYVCKHWLKALCKKGASCDFLHEYNMRKMNECQFYNANGYCQNGDECLYLHVKESARLPACEDYDKGFCEKGPRCAKRHVRRRPCEFYMAGFCPDGSSCTRGVHLKTRGGAVGGDGKAGAVATGAGSAGVDEERRRRLEDLERREEEERRKEGWGGAKYGGGRGRKGKWQGKRNR